MIISDYSSDILGKTKRHQHQDAISNVRPFVFYTITLIPSNHHHLKSYWEANGLLIWSCINCIAILDKISAALLFYCVLCKRASRWTFMIKLFLCFVPFCRINISNLGSVGIFEFYYILPVNYLTNRIDIFNNT